MLFNLPGNERWYALSWGPDLRIIVLDSEVGDRFSSTWEEQAAWLGEELLASRDYMWKVAAFHRDIVSARERDIWIRDTWAPLFDNYHVNLVMQGHFHAYERSHPINWTEAPGKTVAPESGTIYVVSGGWGAPLYSGTPKWFSAKGPIPEYHFVVVDVYENDTLRLRAINIYGEIIDEFSIPEVPTPAVSLIVVIVSIVVVACAGAVFYLMKTGRLGRYGDSERNQEDSPRHENNAHKGRWEDSQVGSPCPEYRG